MIIEHLGNDRWRFKRRNSTGSRILALLLAVTLLASLVVPAAAAGRNDLTQLAVEQIDNDLVTAQLPG